MPSQHVLLLGGTGPSGLLTAEGLLAKGHRVTIYARTPLKIPASLTANPLLESAAGTLDDDKALSAALAQHPDAVISLLGPSETRWLNPLTEADYFANFYRRLFSHMRENNVKRIYLMSTLSLPDPGDRFSLPSKMVVGVVFSMMNAAWRNIQAVNKVCVDEGQGIEWTQFRLGFLTDDPTEGWTDGFIGDGKSGVKVSRSEVAGWLVEQVDEGGRRWVGGRPVISGKKAE